MPLGVAEVHLVELASEQRGLFPALARADLDDDVLVVERIARDELGPQLLGQAIDLERRGALFLAREVAQVRIVALLQLARIGDAFFTFAQPADRVDDRLELGVLLADRAQAVAVAGDVRVAHRPSELVVPLLDLHESLPQLGRELAHAAASPASASSSDAIATSVIGASGRRVVIAWSSSPGATAARMSGLRSWPAPRRRTSYERLATGITSTRRTTRSTMRLIRGTNAETTIAMTTTNSTKAVPHRAW